MEYIIVQAGGKGTRMEHLTENKPKALVPINNLPMMFHLFRKYPDKKYIIIGDYKYEVLKRYLSAFAKVSYLLVDARGKQGTCAGLKKALNYIPTDQEFMLIWSDLVLPDEFQLPTLKRDIIGLSRDFSCRWRYEKDELIEQPSIENGVAGFFIFQNKENIKEVPEEGEFVRWLQGKRYQFEELGLNKTKEYGLLAEFEKIEKIRHRPFNKLEVIDNSLIRKEGIDEQGRKLAEDEKNWYRTVSKKKFQSIPKIHSYEPFVMEKIEGKNIFEYELSVNEKRELLSKIVSGLKKLHVLESVPVDFFSLQEAYIVKTLKRIEAVRDLIPFSNQEIIKINGKECKNVFFHRHEFEALFERLGTDAFQLIHGDCTFSNIMLQDGLEPVFIDPRGYFGTTKLYGDTCYDWAKLYYSIVGNYDQFNLKRFRLLFKESEVELTIESNHWEEMESYFCELIAEEISLKKLKIIHGIIWLSLTTYAWEDYDSICGAFYNGLFYLTDFL